MDRRGGVFYSLRVRLIVGASVIALVAVFAAGLAAYGAGRTAALIDSAAAAQRRVDLLSGLSARVSDYAVIAVETARPDVPSDARQTRLTSRAERVDEAFQSIGRALAIAVEAAQSDGEAEQMRRATRSLGLARMHAQFDALHKAVLAADGGPELRAHLDGFATQFSPLMNDSIVEEQRDRDAAHAEVGKLRRWMTGLAVGVVLVATGLVVAFYRFLVQPLIGQLGHIRAAAAGIGEGNYDLSLPAAPSREFDWVFGELSRSASRLKQRQQDVDEDRSLLSQTIAERTAELEDANARLSRIDSERRRFFADVGHELRTPLTVILAESELGLAGRLEANDAIDSLRVIHSRARRLNRRIDDLLRVARSETGQVELRDGPFDLATSAREAVADMAPLAKRRAVELISDLSSAPAWGDEDWCRQVICGLIENALRHTPSGGKIEVGCREDGKIAKLIVLDEGDGLPESELDGVFDRFERGEREVSGSGFGVGLALARWVVERQSGTIRLISPATRPPLGGTMGGRGVEVVISLPRGEGQGTS